MKRIINSIASGLGLIVLSPLFFLSMTCLSCVSVGQIQASPVISHNEPQYVLLVQDKSFAEQVKHKNTTYEIRYVYDLNGSTVVIPDGCTLFFTGGELKNGYVDLNNCYIDGNAKIDCKIMGCPSNEHIFTKWFTNQNTELFVLLRNFCSCWYNDKLQIIHHDKKRVIHVAKNSYTVTEGLELRYEEDLTIDFGGSTIIDNIDTYDKLRHCASSSIAMRESSRITIMNCIYQMGDNKGKNNKGGSFIEIGGPHVSTIQPNYDILIESIDGKTNENVGKNFAFINVLGNCYNIDIANINWDGNVASLINLESAMGPMKGSEVKNKFGLKTWPYPDYYGLMPYNVTIRNINGYNRPTASYGYIRTAGAYNVTIQNVYCRNVMEVIELFQADAGNVRSAMNITVSNVSSCWGEDMERPNYAVSVDITRRNPQTNIPNIENTDIAMIRFIDCDFQDNSKGTSDNHYLIRVYGNNGTTVFSNCRMRNTQRAVRIADKINTSLLSHITKFESCLFQDCTVGIDCQNALVSVKDCVFEADQNQKSQINYRILGLSAESFSEAAAMLSVEDNMFRSKLPITKPYVSVISQMSLPSSFRFNVSKNVFNNTKNATAIKATNVKLDAERNIGDKIIE